MWGLVAFIALSLAFWDGATTVMGVVKIFGNNAFGLSTGIFASMGIFATIYVSDRDEITGNGFSFILGCFLCIVALADFITSFVGNLFIAEYSEIDLDIKVYIMSAFLSLCMVASPVILRRAVRKMSGS